MKFHTRTQGIVFLAFAVLLIFTSSSYAKPKDKDRWNEKYDTEVYLFGEKPIPFLTENIDILT